MYCSNRGTLNEDAVTSCKTCGTPIKKPELAGYWRRYGALLLDYVILSIMSFLIMAVFIAISIFISIYTNRASASTYSPTGALSGPLMLLGWAVILVAGILFFTLFEASRWQGTPGKMAVGMAVVDLKGNRIGLGKSLLRNLLKIVSVLILGIGFIMAGFTAKRQGLHDIIAGTTVVMKKSHYLDIMPEAVKRAPEIQK